MKKFTAILLCVCATFLMAACANNGNSASPTPMPNASDTMPSPDVIPGTTAGVPEASMVPEGDAGIGGAMNGDTAGGGTAGGANGGEAAAGGALTGGIINGFEEGKVVDQSEIPDVVQAVKEKYPDAQINSVTMTSHEDKQVYHVMLDGTADTKEIYVDSQGNISPYIAGMSDTANTEGGTSGDTGGSNSAQ